MKPNAKDYCKTCDGEGTVCFDCREPENCLSGGEGAIAGHNDIECPCCEGRGYFGEQEE